MATGQVVFVSRNQGMIVVHHKDGFTLVELLGDEGRVTVGDRVFGDWTAEGSEPLGTASSVLDTYFQGCWGSVQTAVEVARGAMAETG